MKRRRKERPKRKPNITKVICQCGNQMTVRISRKNTKTCWQCRDWISHNRRLRKAKE